MEFRPGLAVAIHGLKGAAELNGKEGTCEAWDATKGRWNVRLPGGDVKALKPENLTPRKSDMTPWVAGAVVILVSALVLQQSGMFDQLGVTSPSGYVKQFFEPYEPPPPKAPKDTVVISFCQG